MPTLNATVFPDEAYVLVEVSWASHPTVTHANVTRRNTVTGEIVTLRPYIAYDDEGNLLLDCNLGLWWDTEPPLDVPLEYCTVADEVPTAISSNCCFPTAGVVAPWVATGATSFNTSAVFAHEGLNSGLFTPNGTAKDPFISQTVTGFNGTNPFTMSAWVLSPQGWNAVQLRLVVTYTNGLSQTFTSPVEIIDDAQWTFLSDTFTPAYPIASSVFSLVFLGIPPNTTLFYVDQIQVTQDVAVTATACETVTVPGNGNFWLKNPLHPCLDIQVGICDPMLELCDDDTRVSFASMPVESYAPNSVLLQPANRRRPIPVNRVRRDVEATLRLIAHDCEARDAILAANEPGDPLLWQAPAEYCTPDRYMSVGVLDDSKISIDHRLPFRLVSLPHVAVDRPVGPADGVCGARIMDLCDIYTSWSALTIAGFSWTDLLLGLASPDGPGVPPLPPGFRIWSVVEARFANWLAVEAGGTRDWGELRDGL